MRYENIKSELSQFKKMRVKKRIKHYNHFIFFDTETNELLTDNYKELTLKLGYALYWDKFNNKFKDIVFYNKDDFWKWVFEISKDKEIIMFAHNTDFDFKVLDGLRSIVSNDYNLTNFWVDACFKLEFQKDNTIIHIWDTMNYFKNFSLAELGQIIDFKKLKVDFKNVDENTLLTYCKRDVEILYKIVKLLMEFLELKDLSELKSTVGSLSFNIFRYKFMKKDIFLHDFKEVKKIEIESYRGGFTDCFKIGSFKEKLYLLDVNSMYPFQMLKYKSPSKLFEYRHHNGKEDLFQLMNFALQRKMDIIAKVHITLDKDHAYILNRVEINKCKKTTRLSGNFWITLTTPEIKYVLKYGKINMIQEIAIYENVYLFKEFVEYFFELRMKFKKENNKPFELFCKIILNCLYGKFAQKEFIFEEIGTSDKFDIKSYLVYFIDKVEIYNHIGNTIYRISKTNNEGEYSFTAISSIITAYARMYLVDLILIAGSENVYYSDTDSLIVNEKGYNNLISFINKEIGMLKIQGISEYTEILKPKWFLFDSKEKLKGIKKDAIKILEGSKGIVYKQDSWKRFKSSMREDKTDRQFIEIMFKIIQKKYDKGIVKNGIVKPYEVNNYDSNEEIEIEVN